MKDWGQEEKTVIIIGAILIFLGFAANKWVVGRIMAPDGNIESSWVNIGIAVIQLALISLGLLIIYYRNAGATQYVADVSVGILLTVVCTLILDRALHFAGYPSKYIPPLAHPANYSGIVQNLEFVYEFKTNSQGIRYREVPLEKAESTTRIVVVGDSFTEGFGVQADQTFTSILEERLSSSSRPMEFINCGLSATWPMQYARILFYVCMNYDPDAVLIALYANDVAETVLSAEPSHIDAVNVKTGLHRIGHTLWPTIYTIFETSLVQNSSAGRKNPSQEIDFVATVSQEARNRGIPDVEIKAWADRLSPDLVTAADRGVLNGQLLSAGLLYPDYWTVSLDLEGDGAEEKYQIMLSILDEIIRRLRARNVPVGLVFIPSAFQYDLDYGDVWKQSGVQIRSEWVTKETELERRLKIWTQTQRLPYLNLTPRYRETVKMSPELQLHYPIDGHWTAQGQAVAADEIAKWLERWMLQRQP